MKKPPLFKRITTLLFGYDVFISYRHVEARKYADELYKSLDSRLFVFLDESDEHSGTSVERFSKIACTARTFVIIVSPEVYQSENVLSEVAAYLSRRMDKWHRRPFSKIICINVDQALSFAPAESAEWKRLRNYVYEPETREALMNSKPSREVVEGISKSAGFMRTWILFLAGISIFSLIIAAGISSSLFFLKDLQNEISVSKAALRRSVDSLNFLNGRNDSLAKSQVVFRQDLLSTNSQLNINKELLSKTNNELAGANRNLEQKQLEAAVILDSLQRETKKNNLNYLQSLLRSDLLKENYSGASERLSQLIRFDIDEDEKITLILECIESCLSRNKFDAGVKFLSQMRDGFYHSHPAKFRNMHAAFLFSEASYLLKQYNPSSFKGEDRTNKLIGCILNKIRSYPEFNSALNNFLREEYYLPLYSREYLPGGGSGGLMSKDGNYIVYYNRDSTVVRRINGDRILSFGNRYGEGIAIHFSSISDVLIEAVYRTPTGASFFPQPELEERAFTVITYVLNEIKEPVEPHYRRKELSDNFYNAETEELYIIKNEPIPVVFAQNNEGHWHMKKSSSSYGSQAGETFDEKRGISVSLVNLIGPGLKQAGYSSLLKSPDGTLFILKIGPKFFLLNGEYDLIAALQHCSNPEFVRNGKYIIDRDSQRLWAIDSSLIFSEVPWGNLLTKHEKLNYGIEFER